MLGGLELRAAIDVYRVAGDPPGIFGCQEGDDATDIVRLRNALKRLHAEHKLLARFSLGKFDISVSTTPGATALTRIPRAPRSEAKCFTKVSTAPLVAAYAGIVPTTARAPSDETSTILLPIDMIGSSCCTRKKGARTLTANSLSKSSTVVSSMVAAFEMPALATRMSMRSPMMPRAIFASL